MPSFLQVSVSTSVGSPYLDTTCSTFPTNVRLLGTADPNTIPATSAQINQSDPELRVQEHVQYRVVDHGSFGHQLWDHGVSRGDSFVPDS